MRVLPSITPAKPRVRRKRRSVVAPPTPPPVVALTLVSAAYNEGGGPGGEALITLAFDRAIDVAGLVGSAITVRDGIVNGWVYRATGAASLLGPATVEIMLVEHELYAVEEQTLGATAGSGIVAVDDGGTWGGVTNVELPFP